MSHLDRASPGDVVNLAVDRGTVPMNIAALLTFDPAGRPLAADVADVVGARVGRVPRLTRRLVGTPLGCGRPVWVDDGSFSLGAAPGPPLPSRSTAGPDDPSLRRPRRTWCCAGCPGTARCGRARVLDRRRRPRLGPGHRDAPRPGRRDRWLGGARGPGRRGARRRGPAAAPAAAAPGGPRSRRVARASPGCRGTRGPGCAASGRACGELGGGLPHLAEPTTLLAAPSARRRVDVARCAARAGGQRRPRRGCPGQRRRGGGRGRRAGGAAP